jgi:hypothetical protein
MQMRILSNLKKASLVLSILCIITVQSYYSFQPYSQRLLSYTLSDSSFFLRIGINKLLILGRTLGFATEWKMFTPVDRMSWQVRYRGILDNNSEIILPYGISFPESPWIEKLLNFRTAKFDLNLYRKGDQQYTYVQYLCITQSNSSQRLIKIGVDYRHKTLISRLKHENIPHQMPWSPWQNWLVFLCNRS